MVSRQRILVIEDDEALRHFAVRTLDLEGYPVLAAPGGDEGMALARKEGCDLVLLDLLMPGRDGWSVLEELKGDSQLRSIPVVVFSASAHKAQQERAFTSGVFDYLVKPLSARDLVASVGVALLGREV